MSRAGSWLDLASGGGGSVRTPAVVNVAVGTAEVLVGAAGAVVRTGWNVTGPVRSLVARPPLVPHAYQPATIVATLEQRGRRYVSASERDTDAMVAALVPLVVGAVLERIDLTEVVLSRVDLDRVVAAVDIEAAVRSLDLTRIVIDSVDLDAIVATVDLDAAVARVDLDAAVAKADLDLAVSRVDLAAIVDRIDIDGIVATVDVEAVVDRVDIDAVAATIDMQAIIDRIDLVGLAQYVIDEIDLPEIIRESTGSVASEAVRGVRMQSIEADQAIQRRIDRLLRRRRASLPLEGFDHDAETVVDDSDDGRQP
jgi:hypothetical protein